MQRTIAIEFPIEVAAKIEAFALSEECSIEEALYLLIGAAFKSIENEDSAARLISSDKTQIDASYFRAPVPA